MPRSTDLYKDSLSVGFTGTVTVGTTAAKIHSNDVALLSNVTVKAAAANAGTVYVGFRSDVSATTGYPLAAGEAIPIAIDDLSKVYAIASEAAQSLHYIAQ
jgi:hypothetical protein